MNLKTVFGPERTFTVAKLRADGLTFKAIGEQLGISPNRASQILSKFIRQSRLTKLGITQVDLTCKKTKKIDKEIYVLKTALSIGINVYPEYMNDISSEDCQEREITRLKRQLAEQEKQFASQLLDTRDFERALSRYRSELDIYKKQLRESNELHMTIDGELQRQKILVRKLQSKLVQVRELVKEVI